MEVGCIVISSPRAGVGRVRREGERIVASAWPRFGDLGPPRWARTDAGMCWKHMKGVPRLDHSPNFILVGLNLIGAATEFDW
jgi:hypothetical protein